MLQLGRPIATGGKTIGYCLSHDRLKVKAAKRNPPKLAFRAIRMVVGGFRRGIRPLSVVRFPDAPATSVEVTAFSKL